MKKWISLMLSMVLLLGLAACSPSSTNTDTKKEDTKKEETQKEETKKDEAKKEDGANASGQELTVWCWDPAFNIYAMEEAEKVYNQKNPDSPIKLNIVETPWADVQTKITAIGSSGQTEQMPDIFLMQDNAFKKNFQFYPDLFADLTDSGIDFSKFGQSKVAYSVVDGKNYGVPFDNGVVVGAFRVDLLADAGFKPEDLKGITWKRFIEIGEQVKAKTGKPMFGVTTGDPDMIMMTLQSCGASLFKEDGSLNIEDNQVLKDAIAVYKEMVEKGIVQEANNWDEYVAGFTGGNVLGTINGCWILASVQTSKDQAGKWVVVDMPRLYDNDAKSTNYANNGGSSWAITGTSQKKELAAKFLNDTFAGSVEFYNTILPSSGAIATYLPAANTDAYKQPQKFFHQEQKVYEDIIEFSSHVPSNATGVFYYEAKEAVGTALVGIVKGDDIDKGLKAASDEVKFKMGQ
ncbi:carbohydrate ABC transporter substrate-binding protein [Clostridiales bacterium COT073_COT-073]|nr:carbohydrate ABC transporter substrate-binding protein [Clostridiales bacterium COT073_COT-073]